MSEYIDLLKNVFGYKPKQGEKVQTPSEFKTSEPMMVPPTTPAITDEVINNVKNPPLVPVEQSKQEYNKRDIFSPATSAVIQTLVWNDGNNQKDNKSTPNTPLINKGTAANMTKDSGWGKTQ